MRSARIAAILAIAVSFIAASEASAQKPKRAPDSPTTQDAGQSQSTPPRDVAVPREAAAPRTDAPKSTPRTQSTRGEGTPLAPSSDTTSNDSAQRSGAVRRPPSDSANAAARDHAVSRVGPPPRDYDDDHDYYRNGHVYYYPSYYSYGRYYSPYYYSGFHLGYLAYGPWGWTPAFYGYPYGYGYGYGSGSGYSAPPYDLGKLRIKVRQRDAEVWVDGYYAGTVDDFDGTFQALKLETGGYKIEIRKPGFETLVFDVHVQPDRTITYRGELRPQP